MKTFGLTILLNRYLRTTGKVVIIDSILCVLKLILETSKRGVYASALIKIDTILLLGVNGELIKDYFRFKEH